MKTFETLAKLRELYPDDIDALDAEQDRISALLRKKDYALQPETQELLALCRKDILAARVKLATERSLTDEARAELWHIIDARGWFLRMVVKDYDAELAQIDQELEANLNV